MSITRTILPDHLAIPTGLTHPLEQESSAALCPDAFSIYPALLPAVFSTAQVLLLSCISASFGVTASIDAQDVSLERSHSNRNSPILSSTTFNTYQSTGAHS